MADAQTMSIDYNGVTVTFDVSQVVSWKNNKAIANFQNNPAGFFDAVDRIMCGKSDEVVEQLGDDMAVMSDVISQIYAKVGGAKN